MLAFAISATMLVAALIAALTIVDTLMQARVAFKRLMAESVAFEAQLAPVSQVRVRAVRAARVTTQARHPAPRLSMSQLQACAAA